MKKRLLAMLLTGAMAATLLAGCGSKADSAKTEEKTNTEAENSGETADVSEENPDAAADAATEGPQTLKVWCWDPTYNINALNVAADIYREEHPDFELDVEEIDGESISAKLATASTSGELNTLPDIILFDDTGFQKSVISYPEVFLDLTDYGFNYEEFSPGKVGMSSVDGRNYGIPFDSGTAIACYRTDILEQAGYTIDDFTDITWEDWIEKAKHVLDVTGCPLLNGLSCYNQLTIMLQSAGGSFFNEDGTANLTDNEILRKTIELYTQMVEAGVYTEETGWDTYIGGMNTGRIAGAMNGCWIMSSLRAAEDQSGKWQITNLPSLDGIEGATNYSSQGGSSWAITTNCANPELAVDFFKSTFGGSTKLYDEILSTGAISTWLPASNGEKYTLPDEFFSGQPVFAMITAYSANVPECYVGTYFRNAMMDVANAVTEIIYSGTDMDSALSAAQDTLNFEMSQQ